MCFSSTACTVFSLLYSVSNLPQLSVYQIQSTIIHGIRFFGIACTIIILLGIITIYNHPKDDFLTFYLCSHRLTGHQFSSTVKIIQEMLSWSSPYTVIGLLGMVYNHLRDAFFLHRLYVHQFSRYDYNHPINAFLRFCLYSHQSTGYGLQSSKG